jgi:Uma2 family endonuclease
MTDNIIIMGVNAPKQHQRIIGKLMTALGHLFYREGTLPYEPFSETMIDEGQTSPTPDILLFDNKTGLNKVIIEVSTSAGAKRDFDKLVELMRDYGIEEGFVYNYSAGIWRKYRLDTGEVLQNPSFCDTINLDLNDFL